MPNRTIADIQQDLRTRFEQAGFETAALDARLLVLAAADITHEQLIAADGIYQSLWQVQTGAAGRRATGLTTTRPVGGSRSTALDPGPLR